MALVVVDRPQRSLAAATLRRRLADLNWRRVKWALQLYVPLAIVVILALACFFGPWLFNLPPANSNNLINGNLPLGAPGHLLGTDPLGNDLLSRSLYGGQVSLEVGLGATALGFAVGGALGMIAGFKGGLLDSILMRVLDVFLAFPALILAMCVAAYLGPSERDEIFAIAFFTMPSYGRLARAMSLRIREREFVQVGKVMNVAPWKIVRRHVLPNVFPPLITVAPITIAFSMVIEAALSYLGLGIRPPAPSWGNMIVSGQPYLSTAPINVLVPSAFLFVTVFALNLVGEQVRLRLER